MMPLDVGPNGANAEAIVDSLRPLAELGVTHVHSRLADVGTFKPLEIMAEKVIPAARAI
jgi:alkanesulfonate monooxygenase